MGRLLEVFRNRWDGPLHLLEGSRGPTLCGVPYEKIPREDWAVAYQNIPFYIPNTPYYIDCPGCREKLRDNSS